MEQEISFRGEHIRYSENGAAILPKHSKTFIEREKSIKALNLQLKNNEISDEMFLKEIGDLFIHTNWFHLVKDAALRMEETDMQTDDSHADEIAEAIFLAPTTSGRARSLSKKYFGDEWVNNF